MHRIDTPDATPLNLFTDGDPAIPIAATVLDADWANAVQQELAHVIESTGAVLNKSDWTQLRAAIDFKIAAVTARLYYMVQI